MERHRHAEAVLRSDEQRRDGFEGRVAAGDQPEFRVEAEREAAKREELAPFVAAAFERKKRMQPLADADIAAYPAYGLTAPPVDLYTLPEANRRRALLMRKMREIAERS